MKLTKQELQDILRRNRGLSCPELAHKPVLTETVQAKEKPETQEDIFKLSKGLREFNKKRGKLLKPKTSSPLETKFEILWTNLGGPDLIREYPVCPGRKFRFDFAIPQKRIAIEVEGGTWVKSGHSSGKGIERDCVKGNLATQYGWRVFRLTAQMIAPDYVTEIVDFVARR